MIGLPTEKGRLIGALTLLVAWGTRCPAREPASAGGASAPAANAPPAEATASSNASAAPSSPIASTPVDSSLADNGRNLCRLVSLTEGKAPTNGLGRFGVSVSTQDDEVLHAHESRLRKLGIEPNGEAWAGILEQCAGHAKKAEERMPKGAIFDPEAGSLAVYANRARTPSE